jgi:hypothetical protein
MKARCCARCDTKGHNVYMCRKDIKIGAIEIENKVDMNYRESAQIGSYTTHSGRFIGNSYNSGEESVFHQALLLWQVKRALFV